MFGALNKKEEVYVVERKREREKQTEEGIRSLVTVIQPSGKGFLVS